MVVPTRSACPFQALAQGRRPFDPDSAFWRVNSELLVNLSGFRAVALELAHPLIAAGVADHSHFRQGGVGRLFRTLLAMNRIVFGIPETARRGLGQIRRCHGAVRGRLRRDAGPFPAGTPYDARDPALQMWVLATLVDSTVRTHELLIRPLAIAEKEEYYQGSRRLARLFGIAGGLVPADWPAFERYFAEMTQGPELAVGPDGRELMDALLGLRGWGFLVRRWSFLGIGTLPAPVRERFGFRWSEKQEARLQKAARLSRKLRAWTPGPLCRSPMATWAELRA